MKHKQLVHVVAASTDSPELHPTNKPDNFVSPLTQTIEMQGDWYVGLKDVFIRGEGIQRGSFVVFDIFLSQASGLMLGGTESSCIKRVIAKATQDGQIYFKMNPAEMTSLKPAATLSRLSLYFSPVFPASLSFDADTPSSVTLVISNSKVL